MASAKKAAKVTATKRTPATTTKTARASGPSAGRFAMHTTFVSSDGKLFELVQVIGKVLGTRAGAVGKVGKTTSRAFTTVKAAKDAGRMRIVELLAAGYRPGRAVK